MRIGNNALVLTGNTSYIVISCDTDIGHGDILDFAANTHIAKESKTLCDISRTITEEADATDRLAITVKCPPETIGLITNRSVVIIRNCVIRLTIAVPVVTRNIGIRDRSCHLKAFSRGIIARIDIGRQGIECHRTINNIVLTFAISSGGESIVIYFQLVQCPCTLARHHGRYDKDSHKETMKLRNS